jgi:ABC-type polysaccharide transport system permease subunit
LFVFYPFFQIFAAVLFCSILSIVHFSTLFTYNRLSNQTANTMRFSTITLFLSLTASVISAPIGKRALTAQTYNEFNVSGGTAGNALAEVNAKFPVAFTASSSISLC